MGEDELSRQRDEAVQERDAAVQERDAAVQARGAAENALARTQTTLADAQQEVARLKVQAQDALAAAYSTPEGRARLLQLQATELAEGLAHLQGDATVEAAP